MLIELVATVAAGFAGAGIAMLLRHLSGGRLPRGLTPTLAGLAMIAFLVWSEFSWFSRTVEALPEGLTVVSSHGARAAWRPWTFVRPVTERFVAFDPGAVRRNERFPNQAIVELLLFARRSPLVRVPVLVDCAGPRRADLVDGADFDEAGAVVGATWMPLAPDDPLVAAVCTDS